MAVVKGSSGKDRKCQGNKGEQSKSGNSKEEKLANFLAHPFAHSSLTQLFHPMFVVDHLTMGSFQQTTTLRQRTMQRVWLLQLKARLGGLRNAVICQEWSVHVSTEGNAAIEEFTHTRCA